MTYRERDELRRAINHHEEDASALRAKLLADIEETEPGCMGGELTLCVIRDHIDQEEEPDQIELTVNLSMMQAGEKDTEPDLVTAKVLDSSRGLKNPRPTAGERRMVLRLGHAVLKLIIEADNEASRAARPEIVEGANANTSG